MGNVRNVENLVTEITYYGYPVASFDETVLSVWGREVFVDKIYWDNECRAFVGVGHYSRKDGTRGRRSAKPIMQEGTVPENVLSALKELIPPHA